MEKMAGRQIDFLGSMRYVPRGAKLPNQLPPSVFVYQPESCSLPEIPVAIVASNAIIAGMATLTIRQLDEKTKTRLRIRAAHHGRSMEEEAREILRSALTTSSPPKGNLAEAIHRRFAAFGGIELPPVKRDALRDIPGFEE